jgi:hypothetical protein
MKSSLISLCCAIFIMGAACMPRQAQAQIDPRAKAMATMALYGTVGGALLGTASLAFGTKGRSVAIGASLGLYAGLIFGSYVVVSHMIKTERLKNPQPQENYYPNVTSPYEDFSSGGDPNGAPAGEYGYRWVSLIESRESSINGIDALKNMQQGMQDRQERVYQTTLLQWQF